MTAAAVGFVAVVAGFAAQAAFGQPSAAAGFGEAAEVARLLLAVKAFAGAGSGEVAGSGQPSPAAETFAAGAAFARPLQAVVSVAAAFDVADLTRAMDMEGVIMALTPPPIIITPTATSAVTWLTAACAGNASWSAAAKDVIVG